ncbi:MAG TPA: error-prone DNA polymerase [Polyangia bacterium]|nr:error-prone DNA polymerase [Polyangia bacterium]
MDYVELRCRSAFSFLDGATLPEEIAEAAAQQGYGALALGDRDGVYGAPRFFGAARKYGIRPIVGAEVTLAGAPPVLLLVESQVGYRNLCRLLTRAKAGHKKQPAAWTELGPGTIRPAAGVSHDLLAEHAGGLIALGGAAARADLPRLLSVFGRDRLYLEVQRHLDAAQAHAGRAALDQARAHGIGVVATNDVRYARPDQRAVHDVLTCARHHRTVDEIGRFLACNGERWLKPAEQMQALFADLPAAVRATRAIAERCAFTLADLGYVFPAFDVPAGHTQQSFLEELAWNGVRARYRDLPAGDPLLPKVRAQLERELAIIGKLDLAGYFLVVWDIVRFAKESGIMIQGRGSAANSAACYVLEITAVDPVKMDLLFERFLSEERVHSASSVADRLPDIDLDLPSGDKREAVIQYVYRKYGARGAAMTANVITYRPRMAVRDCGRALGFSEEQLARIAKHLPGWIHGDDEPLAGYLEAAGFSASDGRTRLLADVATAMLNLPRHLGQHSGGMVIAANHLDEVVPLEPASMPGRVVVQWDKDDCADLGIVKVDLLGLGMMAVLEDCAELVGRHEGQVIDYAQLPAGDPAVYDMLCAADTVGVFQVESRAQMATLPRMQPRCFYDLVVEVAIIRPGPIVGKMLNPYLSRRRKTEQIRYPHPSLEPILKRTLGVPLFQEQLIRMAMAAAGFSGGQAEELRRAMGFKRSIERMRVIETDLRAGMRRNGITGDAQEEIVAGIKSFALYGFPESHAASFALIAYASAFLKAHHGAAFLCALLNNYPMGFYHPATLITDAIRHGIEVRPIDVVRSGWRCDLEGGNAVRLGLNYVTSLRQEVGERLVRERAARPFSSLGDLQARVQPKAAEMATLAEIGALGPLGGTRRQALWQVEALERSGALFAGGAGRAGVSAGSPAAPAPSPLAEMTTAEETGADFRGTGVSTGPHPVAAMREALTRAGVLSAAALARVPDGRRARIGGVVIVRQRPGTAKGFVFLTLEDETGFSNAIITPDRFARHKSLLLTNNALIIEGVVQNQQGVVSLKADGFSALTGRVGDVDISHDFH